MRETAPPRGREPLEWLLLSSDGEPAKRDALRIVQRYESRWSIEEYFRVVKSGMRIQDRRLRTGAGLAKRLAFDAIEAWRVFQLDRYTRDAPDTPATGRHSQLRGALGAHGRVHPVEAAPAAGQQDPVARVAAPATVDAHAAGGGREPGGPASRTQHWQRAASR